MKYRLTIKRVCEDFGTVEIEAESIEEAKRKYFNPDCTKGEEVIFDDEIDWDENEYEYELTDVEEI